MEEVFWWLGCQGVRFGGYGGNVVVVSGRTDPHHGVIAEEVSLEAKHTDDISKEQRRAINNCN